MAKSETSPTTTAFAPTKSPGRRTRATSPTSIGDCGRRRPRPRTDRTATARGKPWRAHRSRSESREGPQRQGCASAASPGARESSDGSDKRRDIDHLVAPETNDDVHIAAADLDRRAARDARPRGENLGAGELHELRRRRRRTLDVRLQPAVAQAERVARAVDADLLSDLDGVSPQVRRQRRSSVARAAPRHDLAAQPLDVSRRRLAHAPPPDGRWRYRRGWAASRTLAGRTLFFNVSQSRSTVVTPDQGQVLRGSPLVLP